jgi:hypothetical protein
VNELLGHDQSIVANEGAAGGSNALLTVGCEGDVGGSCMASVERPFGLAVADDEATRSRHAVARYGREPGKRKKKEEEDGEPERVWRPGAWIQSWEATCVHARKNVSPTPGGAEGAFDRRND